MKALTLITLIVGLCFSISTFASCGSTACDSGCSSNNGDACDTTDWSNEYAYQNHRSCECACTDEGYQFNDCISKSAYCEAFGNLGGL